MDRNELAARFAVALAPSYYGQGYGDDDLARDAAHKADTLMSVLAESSKSTPAPVAPPATVGEGLDDIERSAQALADFKGTIPPGASDAFMLGWRVRDREAPCDGVARTTNAPTPAPEGPVRLFPPVIVKTDVPPMVGEVCRTPAPEAKRPTHVRITGPKDHRSVTIGKVYEVLYFDDDRARLIIKNDDGLEWGLSNRPDDGPAFPTWEPAPCPPPVAGSAELVDPAYAAFREYVEANYKDGVILGNVSWHIPRLWRAAKDALSRPVRP